MTTRRIKQQAGWFNQYHQAPRGANGRLFCRCCGVEVPKGRRTFCSDLCVHQWKLETNPGYVREQVLKRDKGVCAVCGTNTRSLKRRIEKLPRSEHGRQCKELGFPVDGSSWWHADHIVPVAEGGGECGLDNYRTLCVPCHKRATKELHARLKQKRRDQKRADFV